MIKLLQLQISVKNWMLVFKHQQDLEEEENSKKRNISPMFAGRIKLDFATDLFVDRLQAQLPLV